MVVCIRPQEIRDTAVDTQLPRYALRIGDMDEDETKRQKAKFAKHQQTTLGEYYCIRSDFIRLYHSWHWRRESYQEELIIIISSAF